LRSFRPGGQPVSNVGSISDETMARGAGYPGAHAHDNLESFAIDIASILTRSGPAFVAMKVVPEIQNGPIG
jgi:hypothetical protein